LTYGATPPIVGTFSAVVKLALGVTQLTCAVAYGVFTKVNNLVSNRHLPTDCAWLHAKHGAGNIGASIIEGTPLLGTVSVIVRIFGCPKLKFMPYPGMHSR